MSQRALGLAALAVVMLVSNGSAATAGDGTWVSAKGRSVPLDGHAGVFVKDGATQIRMEDLADGETRVIGAGEKQIVATRRGEVVTFTRDAVGETAALDLECTIGRDSCKIVTFEDDPERVMLIVEKVRRCVNGEGDCDDTDVTVHAMAGPDGGHALIHKVTGEPGEAVSVIRVRKSECDAEGNCREVEDVMSDTTADVFIEELGPGAHVSGKPGPGTAVFIRHAGDQVALRCSAGDTTMHVDPQEADEVFLCPKHSTPLEKIAAHPRVLHQKVRRDVRDSN